MTDGMSKIMEDRLLGTLQAAGPNGLRVSVLAAQANVQLEAALAILPRLELEGRLVRELKTMDGLIADVWTVPEPAGREDRELMMESRILHVLRERPDSMIAADKIAKLASMREETARRLLGRLQAKGHVCRSMMQIDGCPEAELWQVPPTPDADDAPGEDAVECRIFDLLLRRKDMGQATRTSHQIADALVLSHADTMAALDRLESQGVLVAHDFGVDAVRFAWSVVEKDDARPDLPDGWVLLPPDESTAELHVLYVMAPKLGSRRTWHVGLPQPPGIRNIYILTDIPHPDDPGEECVFMLDFAVLLDALVGAVVPGREDAQ